MKTFKLIVGACVCLFIWEGSVLANSTACITVTVTTASSQPITNADVTVGFFQTATMESSAVAKGLTDASGMFTATDATVGHVIVRVEKDGFNDGFAGMIFSGAGPWGTNFSITMTELPEAGVTVQVLGLDNQPIADADVGVGFEHSFDTRTPWRYQSVNGHSDTNGRFFAAGKTLASIGVGVTKPGYYVTHRTVDIGTNTAITVPVVLKERKNPIPMYAKDAELEKPGGVTNKWYGYDLIIGDWVRPYGRGLTNDFLFKIDGYVNDPYNDGDVTRSLSFSNPNDGVLLVNPSEGAGSELRSRQEAPIDGYVNSRSWRMKRQGDTVIDDCLSGVDYYFRIRSATNAAGQVTNALYGKIYGEIGDMAFTYFLNPDGTRNVEFDPRRNLFPTPGGHGQISVP